MSSPHSTTKPKFNTLTTAGRLAKAAHERAQSKTKPKQTCPSPTPPATAPKKKRKTAILPPPAELEAETTRRIEAKLKKKENKLSKVGKPITTQDKLAARKKKQAAVPAEHDGTFMRSIGGIDWEEETQRVKGSKLEKPRNLMDFMRELEQMSAADKAPAVAKKVQIVAHRAGGSVGSEPNDRESVLVRPTQRTKRMQQQQRCQSKNQVEAIQKDSTIEIKRGDDDNSIAPRTGTGLMSLPEEIRRRIWRLAVVETHLFVYPAVNAEQPDLAMTSKQIRSEVLPLYYGENTFAIEIPVSSSAMGKRKTEQKPRLVQRVSLAPVGKWVVALAEGRHIGMVRQWALSWVPPATREPTERDNSADSEYMIGIRFPEPGSAIICDTRPHVEIHREAVCLLENHELARPCHTGNIPEWLDAAVSAAILTGGDRGNQILLIAKDVQKRGGELVRYKCKDEIVDLE